MNHIYIFGAHSRAQTLGHYITYLDNAVKIEAYLYDNDEENPPYIDGVPVIKLDDGILLDENYPVYLGVKGVFHEKKTLLFKEYGIKTIIPVDVDFDTKIRNEYLKKYFSNIGKPFVKIDDLEALKNDKRGSSASIYVINSIYDGELSERQNYTRYHKVLQVGCALSEEKIQCAKYRDDEGDNISCKNSQYSELTGLYWIWKNSKNNYVGLEHYRRHFILPENWVDRVVENDIDVILPVPLYVVPNIRQNYYDRHEKCDWENMMEYLKKYLPDDYIKAKNFFDSTGLYSPCNMMITKKEALDELCGWLFPILFYIEELGGKRNNEYDNRYPGFVSERLVTFFFESRANKYKIVYADKNFLK